MGGRHFFINKIIRYFGVALGIFICSIFLMISSCLANPSLSQLKKLTFHSTTLGIEKSFNIYLPKGYDDNEKRYPVLYLFRAHVDEWKDRGNIKEIVDKLVSDRLIGEMIIVLPGLSFEGSFLGFPVNMLEPG